jgi:hypothetical protein
MWMISPGLGEVAADDEHVRVVRRIARERAPDDAL